MDIRVLLVIAVFTALFYQICFFQKRRFIRREGRQHISPYHTGCFYAELIESWGTSLPRRGLVEAGKKKELEEVQHPDHCGGFRFLQMQKLRIIRNFRRHGKHFLIGIINR